MSIKKPPQLQGLHHVLAFGEEGGNLAIDTQFKARCADSRR